MPHDDHKGSRLSLLLFYFLAFLLLWEWLRRLTVLLKRNIQAFLVSLSA